MGKGVKPMPAKPGMGKGVKPMPAKPNDRKMRALKQAMMNSQAKKKSSAKSGLDNTTM
jgi:hypothetical protein